MRQCLLLEISRKELFPDCSAEFEMKGSEVQ